MWRYHHGWFRGNFLARGTGLLLLLALVALVANALLRAFPQNRDRSTNGRSTDGRAEELLADRFARGEIDADEFQRGRDLLRDGGQR
jgi:putative membrane protein